MTGSLADYKSVLDDLKVKIKQALTWYHHITLPDKVKDPETRQFYIIETSKNGWSRNMMVNQIESGLHTRMGAAITNFKTTIPPYESDLVQQIFKDPYNFDFLQITRLAKEREPEVALIDHITKFLLELGEGFAFLGHQYRLKSGDTEFEVDLLFYHIRLRRYIVIDLKIGDFQSKNRYRIILKANCQVLRNLSKYWIRI